jgi:hypothetical protein
MENIKTLKRNFAIIGDGALLIWWGIVIMIDPLTISMGAIGTGLIMLGVNAARVLSGIPAKGSTTIIGSIALVWGALDTIFNPSFELSFAILLIIIGLATIGSLLSQPRTGIYL